MSEPFHDFVPYLDALDEPGRCADLARWVARWVDHRRTLASCDVLDLGCGTGALAVELQRYACRVRGVDVSAGSIVRARAKGIDAYLGDACVWSDPDGRRYEAVTALFHVASYQLTRASLFGLLRTAALHLKPRGWFLFDVWYGPAVFQHPPAPRVKEVKTATAHLLRIANPTWHEDRNQVQVHYRLWVIDHEPIAAPLYVRSLSETHTLRYWFLPELREVASEAGFEIVDTEQTPDRYNLSVVARLL